MIQVLLIVWLAGSLLAEGPVPRLAETAGGSTAVRTLALFLPPPTEIATGLGGWLDTTGLPDVFVGFEPLPAPPVDRPDDPAARAIAAAAEASTLKVSAATCGLTSVGTGFVVSPSYVVTNAHVVAGAGGRGVRVLARGQVLDAVPVLFDPDLDVALLHVDGLRVTALRFAAQDPSRGALGATLGYPGGGRLTVVPAAVADRYPATGSRHLRHGPRPPRDPRAPRRDRPGRQRRSVDPRGRDRRWRRLRGGADGSGRGLRARGDRGLEPDPDLHRPDRGRRHGRLHRRSLTARAEARSPTLRAR